MRYCQRVTELVSKAKEIELSWLEKKAMNMHLLLCPRCKRFQRNCHTLSKMMRQFAQSEEKKATD